MKHKLFILLALTLFSASAWAQSVTVKGTVIDEKHREPLIGVKILEKGTANGTITNPDGEFILTVASGAVLEISYVGYRTVEAPATPAMQVLLAEDTKMLDDVVVVGYGTVRSKDLTSSITTIKSDEVMKTPAGQVMQSLQGKVAGMQVVSTGNPGDQPKIRVRGVGSFPGMGDENPLYVVDGMFFDNIDFLNPSDIATVSILKDASAAAIYGVRAANGVVLIETKSGTKQTDRFEVSYNGYYGVQHAQNVLKMANAEQYTQMAIEAGTAADLALIQAAMQRFGRSRVNPNVPDVNTDWYKEIMRDAPIQNHAFDVMGGSQKASYTFGINYFAQQGLLKMKNEYERFNLRAKIDYKPTDYFSVGGNVIFSNGVKYDQEGNAWRNAYFAVPILPVYDELNTEATPTRYSNAKYLGYRNGQNPFPAMDNANNQMQIRKLLSNFYAQLDFIPNKLSLRTTYNHAYTSLYQRNVQLPYNTGMNVQNSESQLKKIHQIYSDQIWDNVLTFTEDFGANHHLTAMAGTSYRSLAYDMLQGGAHGFETEYEQSWYISQVPSANRPQNAVIDDGLRQYGLSYFGRVNYSFANKYILYATMRADGSSKYQEKWGYFPSVGAGWVVSEENFWQGVKGIDYLKLRAGWGQLGNENVAASAGSASTAPITAALNGTKYAGTITTSNFSYLHWERTDETNLGITAKLFQNRLDIDADYFVRDTKDAVIDVLIPAVGGSIRKNAGVLRNSGFELALNWNDQITSDFSYNIGINLSTLKNRVLNLYGQNYLDGGSAEFRQRSTVGQPVFSFFGRQVEGVYQTQQEIDNDPIAQKVISLGQTLVPGDFKYRDINGDGNINDDDRTFLGSYFPTFMYGANLGFSYKNWDFAASLMGQTGNKILNRKRGEFIWTNDTNMDADLAINRWHGAGTSNKYPSAAGLRKGWNQKMSDYFVEDGSFFRIQNIQLAYSFKDIAIGAVKIPLAKIILTAERPLTLFKYNGFNPEVENGIDTQTYPIPAVYTVGLNVKF